MKNKILIELVVPELEETYNIYIPINKTVGSIINLLAKAITELTNNVYQINNATTIYNADTKETYKMDAVIYDTDIRNGTKLVLF